MSGPVRRPGRPGIPQHAHPARPGVRRGRGVHDPVGALPVSHPAGGATDCHWALAWVGVDSSEALALFATGWLLLRADNRCVLAATATAVLLLTDAWLDLTSAAPGGELLTAIAMAVFAEVPIALACVVLALRLIRHPFPSAAETAGTDKYEE